MTRWTLLLPILTAAGGLAVGLWWGRILGERRVYRQWRGRAG